MARVLVVYSTSEGHTEDVVKVFDEHVMALISSASIHCTAVENVTDGLAAFDGVVVASSIHVGHHKPDLVRWVHAHASQLAARPSAFIQVSLSSADPARASDAKDYASTLIEESGWHPDLVALIGGALLYTKYGFAKKHLVKAIAKKGGLGTDLSRDYDYTDYDAVRQFARDFAAMLEPRDAAVKR